MVPMALKIRGSLFIILTLGVVAAFAVTTFGGLRGFVAWNDPSLEKMLAIGDQDADSHLSTNELRKTLVTVIRKVIVPPADITPYDLDGSAALDRADIRRAIAVARDLLTATCGDGQIGSGEQCDDGNVASGDGCSATCRIESGYICAGTPSACSCQDASCGGNTIRIVESENGNLITRMAYGTDGFPIITYGSRVGDEPLRIAKCTDPTCTGNITISTPSTERFVAFQSPVLMGSDDLPVIAFAGMDANSLTVMHCGDQSCATGNTLTKISNTGISTQADFLAMTIGPDGFPFIVFNEEIYRNTTQEYKLEVIHCGSVDCSANNTLTVLDTAPVSQAFASWFADPSVQIGTDGYPVIAYSKGFGVNGSDLVFIHCTDATCSTFDAPRHLEAGGRAFNPSIAIAQDGFPAIAYTEDGPMKVRFIKCQNVGCTSVNPTVEIGDGITAALLVIGADGNPLIATSPNGTGLLPLLVHHCTNSACTGTIETATVDGLHDARSPYMVMSPQGVPAISYGSYPEYKVRLATCATATCQ